MPPHQSSHMNYETQSHSHVHLDQNLEYDLSSHQPPSLPSHHRSLTTLRGHASYVSSLVLAGKFLYSGSSDKEMRSWRRNPSDYSDQDDENPSNNVVAEGKGAVKSLIVLHDKLISAHQDHKIRVWKIIISPDSNDHQRYSCLATLPTLGDRALKLLSSKNQVRVHRHKTSTWVKHNDAVSALALSSDHSFLYSVSWDRTLKIWRTSDFKCLESVADAHNDAINAVATSQDGDVYTGSADNKIKVWRKESSGDRKHSLVTTLEKHKSGINALALSVNGLVLFSGSLDRSILVWEKDDDNNLVFAGSLRGHTKSILCLFVVGDILCSGSADGTVRVWIPSGTTYSCLAVLEGHQGPVKCLTATTTGHPSSSHSSYLIYSGSLDCDIKVWQINVPPLQ